MFDIWRCRSPHVFSSPSNCICISGWLCFAAGDPNLSLQLKDLTICMSSSPRCTPMFPGGVAKPDTPTEVFERHTS